MQDYSPWSTKESDMTEQLSIQAHLLIAEILYVHNCRYKYRGMMKTKKVSA